VDPNSQNQLWSKWQFEVYELSRHVSRDAIEYNVAKWLRLGFGSVGTVKISRTAHGWRFALIVEGRPAHDPDFVQSVRVAFNDFVEKGWGRVGAFGSVTAEVIAGSKQDGAPASQWVGIPMIKLEV
jgi:hypothetical protein